VHQETFYTFKANSAFLGKTRPKKSKVSEWILFAHGVSKTGIFQKYELHLSKGISLISSRAIHCPVCVQVIRFEYGATGSFGGFNFWVRSPGVQSRRDMTKSSDRCPQSRCIAIWLGLRTRVQFRVPPPLLKPQLLSVGTFSDPLATDPACLCGFLGKPAYVASRPSGPFSATFRSLLAILLSGIALSEWPEVRKGPVQHHFKSTGYERTVQAVGLGHCLPGEDNTAGGSIPLTLGMASVRLREAGALVIP